MEEHEKLEQGDISDIVFKDETKSLKARKFLFFFIVVAVLAIVIFVVVSSFSSKEEDNSNLNLEVYNEQDPFFMDSPADIMEPLDKRTEEQFSKDKLLEKENSNQIHETSKGESIFQSAPSSDEVALQPAPIHNQEVDKQNLIQERKYYIQAGTFLKAHPNEKFLKEIENLGYTPIVDMYIKDGKEIRRVLIGPFDTRGDASEPLQKVRGLVKDAYILKTRLH